MLRITTLVKDSSLDFIGELSVTLGGPTGFNLGLKAAMAGMYRDAFGISNLHLYDLIFEAGIGPAGVTI